MMTLLIALPEIACRSRARHGLAGRVSTDYHPSDRAIGKGQIRAAWGYVLVAATLAVGVPLLGSGIDDLGHAIAASQASNAVVHPGSGATPCP